MDPLPPDVKKLIVKEKRQRERWDRVLEQIGAIRQSPSRFIPYVNILREWLHDKFPPGLVHSIIVLRATNGDFSPFFAVDDGNPTIIVAHDGERKRIG
jgi:hypothetical protein